MIYTFSPGFNVPFSFNYWFEIAIEGWSYFNKILDNFDRTILISAKFYTLTISIFFGILHKRVKSMKRFKFQNFFGSDFNLGEGIVFILTL